MNNTTKTGWARGYNREHFLADLVNKHDLTKVIELGIWKGRTFLHLLTHCPETQVYGVDSWCHRPDNADVPGGETYESWDMIGLEAHVRKCAKVFGSRATILKTDTASAALDFEDETFDLVFIDADHSAGGVSRDIDSWASKVRSGGYVTGHDIDWPTVKEVIEVRYPEYQVGPDNVWWVQKP